MVPEKIFTGPESWKGQRVRRRERGPDSGGSGRCCTDPCTKRNILPGGYRPLLKVSLRVSRAAWATSLTLPLTSLAGSLPLLPTPRWLKRRVCAPLAVQNLLHGAYYIVMHHPPYKGWGGRQQLLHAGLFFNDTSEFVVRSHGDPFY